MGDRMGATKLSLSRRKGEESGGHVSFCQSSVGGRDVRSLEGRVIRE